MNSFSNANHKRSDANAEIKAIFDVESSFATRPLWGRRLFLPSSKMGQRKFSGYNLVSRAIVHPEVSNVAHTTVLYDPLFQRGCLRLVGGAVVKTKGGVCSVFN